LGDNPVQLADSGGVGAVWIKARSGGAGHIRVEAENASQGKKLVAITVRSLVNREHD
jgi:hypothetical protein